MPDFSDLLRTPSGQAKRPKALPSGDYPGIIKGYEMGETKEKRTRYVRFNVGLVGWPDGIEPDDEIDISKKQLRRDYFFTDDALIRLDDFISSCGIQLGREYGEILGELQGCHVIVSVTQRIADSGGQAEVFNDVAKMTGA